MKKVILITLLIFPTALLLSQDECQCKITISDVQVSYVSGNVSGITPWTASVHEALGGSVLYQFTQEGEYFVDITSDDVVMDFDFEILGCNESLGSNPATKSISMTNYLTPNEDVRFSNSACACPFWGDCNVELRATVNWECPVGINPQESNTCSRAYFIIGNPNTTGICSDIVPLGMSVSPCCPGEAGFEVEIQNLTYCTVNKESLIVSDPNGTNNYCDPINYTVNWSNGESGCQTTCLCGREIYVTVTDNNTLCEAYDSYVPISCSWDVQNGDYESRSSTNNQEPINLIPNPAFSKVQITNVNEEELNQLNIYNSTGSIQPFRSFNSPKGIQLDVSNFSPGVYFIAIESKSQRKILKLVKI